MKRVITVFIVLTMLFALSACKGAESVPGSTTEDAVTEQSSEDIVTEQPAEDTVTEQPAEDTVTEQPTEDTATEQPSEEVNVEEDIRAIWVYSPSSEAEGAYNLKLSASLNGEDLWTFTLDNVIYRDYKSPESLGRRNGLEYINIEVITDTDMNADGTYPSESRIYAIDLLTGETAWVNTEYGGLYSFCDFDDEGNLYIGCAEGPDCMKIDRNGNTVWKIDSASDRYYGLCFIHFWADVITLSYEGCYDESLENEWNSYLEFLTPDGTPQ